MTEAEMEAAKMAAIVRGDLREAHRVAEAYFYDLYANVPRTDFQRIFEAFPK